MAVLCFIAGSVFGWIVAVIAFLAGASIWTALTLFMMTSLGFVAVTLFAACLRKTLMSQ